jgi:16S rRNA (cytidine1402-2'-O)-methyltransferase
MKGKLLLLPTGLNENVFCIPQHNTKLIRNLKYFIVEELRTARRFLKKIDNEICIDELEFFILNEHTDISMISQYLKMAQDGHDIGLLSEAGTPCVADPGSEIVRIAHEYGIQVVPLSGPSSIIMALMSSGFNGQNFTFHGYLPVDKTLCLKKIKDIETSAYRNDQTQIFIETPYRNNQLLDNILTICRAETRLCIAVDLTSENEKIISKSVKEWRLLKADFHKRPAVFLLYH